jgi:acetyl-CoA C-acetyltransferase
MSEKTPQDVVIVSAARTPVGRFQGGLSAKTAPELGGIAVQEAVKRAGVDPQTVYEVIMGHVLGAGTGQAPARQAALNSGLPNTVGAASVNKVCGSGLKAVMLAANGIAAGEADVYVAGGMESMSNAPYLLPKARTGFRYGNVEAKDAILHDGLWCAFEDWAMGNAAEFIGKKFELTREELDEFALRSHDRAAQATAAGKFKDEIVPVEVRTRKKTIRVEKDEPIRASYDDEGGYTLGTDLETLAKLRPAFESDGIVTAGNAPGLNDGAAALVIMSRQAAEEQGLKPMARIVGYTHAAVPPQWIFSAPAKALPRLLDKIGWSLDEVDLLELNEAFSSQALANGAELSQNGYNWRWDKVNVNGGAVALGHPIGASGARILVTLLYALQHSGGQKGIASLCLGGGEAVALAVEMD